MANIASAQSIAARRTLRIAAGTLGGLVGGVMLGVLVQMLGMSLS